ncbi:MAG: hypothetical protein AAFP76_10330 [Bacteroidota bacterium]
MTILFFILIFLACIVFAYFFPEGVKIFGIPAEEIFKKEEESDAEDTNYYP